MERENETNLGIFTGFLPSAVQIKDYISMDDNILTEDNRLISDMINCNEDDLSEKETDQHDEEYEPKFGKQ